MDVEEFRNKVNIDCVLIIDKIAYIIKELVKFRLDDGSSYIKCYLNNGYIFADDESENTFLLVKPMKNDIAEPFSKKVKFDGKEFDFLYVAHATAIKTFGDNSYFPQGQSEKFWDYKAEDGSYLSLGINDQTSQRADFYGKIIQPNEFNIKGEI